MGDPWAIRRYKAQEQTYYDRDKALKDQVTEAARTSWYEKANRQLPNVKDKDRADEVMEKDLKLSADQLAQARRQRLRDLYAAEMLGWQAELAAKGLAIEIRKD